MDNPRLHLLSPSGLPDAKQPELHLLPCTILRNRDSVKQVNIDGHQWQSVIPIILVAAGSSRNHTNRTREIWVELSPVSTHLSCIECHLLNRDMALAMPVFEPRNLHQCFCSCVDCILQDCERSAAVSGMGLHALLGRRRLLLATVVGLLYLDLIHPSKFNKYRRNIPPRWRLNLPTASTPNND